MVVVLASVVICGGLAAIGFALFKGGSSSQNPQATTVAMNQPGQDGKFEFTVTKIECGILQIGSDSLSEKAQGQFCLVHVTVKNIGNEARTFDDSNQYAYNAAGHKYDADGVAGMYLDDSNAFLEDINPGNSVNGVVVFDIPASARITKLELHDSGFSNGVIVNVT